MQNLAKWLRSRYASPARTLRKKIKQTLAWFCIDTAKPSERMADALDAGARRLRIAGLFALAAAFAWCAFHDPSRPIAWLPIPTSCGSISGLPCLFCGGTRAMHHLLHGHFSAALYYNWLAFPTALLGAFLMTRFALELAAGRNLRPPAWRVRFTLGRAALAFILVVACWLLQVWLAISQRKQELLNLRGPLYSLFVK